MTEAEGQLSAGVVPALGPWLDARRPDLAVIDMPTGLADRGRRVCDQLARRALRPHRGASLFPTPVRGALGHSSYAATCAAHRAVDGRAISKQTWCILPKILELDRLCLERPEWRDALHEGHPELSFATWNGGRPLEDGKRTAAGRIARRALVDDVWPGQIERLIAALRGAAFAPDDLLDACAVLWTARRIAAGTARRFPDPPPVDATGLRMCITA